MSHQLFLDLATLYGNKDDLLAHCGEYGIAPVDYLLWVIEHADEMPAGSVSRLAANKALISGAIRLPRGSFAQKLLADSAGGALWQIAALCCPEDVKSTCGRRQYKFSVVEFHLDANDLPKPPASFLRLVDLFAAAGEICKLDCTTASVAVRCAWLKHWVKNGVKRSDESHQYARHILSITGVHIPLDVTTKALPLVLPDLYFPEMRTNIQLSRIAPAAFAAAAAQLHARIEDHPRRMLLRIAAGDVSAWLEIMGFDLWLSESLLDFAVRRHLPPYQPTGIALEMLLTHYFDKRRDDTASWRAALRLHGGEPELALKSQIR